MVSDTASSFIAGKPRSHRFRVVLKNRGKHKKPVGASLLAIASDLTAKNLNQTLTA
jgi:hypothetical protein